MSETIQCRCCDVVLNKPHVSKRRGLCSPCYSRESVNQVAFNEKWPALPGHGSVREWSVRCTRCNNGMRSNPTGLCYRCRDVQQNPTVTPHTVEDPDVLFEVSESTLLSEIENRFQQVSEPHVWAAFLRITDREMRDPIGQIMYLISQDVSE